MTRFKLIIIAAVMALAGAIPAAAQFKFGPKAGVSVNSLHFSRDVFDSDNRTGFTGGLMCEFTVPVVGIGLDASLMYVRRSVDAEYDPNTGGPQTPATTTIGRDYITIPVNLKWKFGIPVVKPFLTTGPEFSFLTSRKAIKDAWRNKSVDYSWNFGAGVELLGHLQVAASYGLGLNKVLQNIGLADNATKVNAKNRYWTITAAYLF